MRNSKTKAPEAINSQSGEVMINGYLHKIGRKGFIYMQICGDWIRSTKSLAVFNSAKAGKRNVNRESAVRY